MGVSPGLESLVLSENFSDDVVGPGRPARGTLVSTVPTELLIMITVIVVLPLWWIFL